MLKKLIGAVAVEDNEISFAVSPFEPNVDSLKQRIDPISVAPKPDTGFSKSYIEKKIKEFFDNQPGDFAAIGVSMFGVIDAGNCTLHSVPRRDWDKADFPSERASTINLNFSSIFEASGRWRNTHIGVANDATTSALGESSEHVEGRRNSGAVFAYVRIGSGINAGVLRDGRPLRNRRHPEIGHVRPIRHPNDLFQGCCDFHKDCFDGLASFRAIAARVKCPIEELNKQPEHPVWDLQSYYFAQVCTVLSMTLAPDCIVLGGTIMQDHIFRRTRDHFGTIVGNYPRYTQTEKLFTYIRAAKIKDYASLRGALWLAQIKGEDSNVISFSSSGDGRRKSRKAGG